MLNMLKVHGGNRVAQRAGNRIRSLNAGSPGSVVAEVCWDWKSWSSYSCSVLSRHQLPRERHSPSQRDITATGGVQQPPLGQELAPCRRALMVRRGEACMVTATSMENVYHLLVTAVSFQDVLLHQKVVNYQWLVPKQPVFYITDHIHPITLPVSEEFRWYWLNEDRKQMTRYFVSFPVIGMPRMTKYFIITSLYTDSW